MYDDESIHEVLDAVRAAVPAGRMQTPVQHIAAAARSRRRRRGLAGLTGAGLAVAAGVALALPSAGAGHSAPTARVGTATLAGWTVRTEADGTVVVTMSQLFDKAALQRVLAEHGVPAVVYAGSTICEQADGERPSGAVQVFKPSTDAVNGRSVLDIKPAAIPPGAEVLFNITVHKDGDVIGAFAGLLRDGAAVECRPPGATPPATPPAKN